jgi:hypothetical protein
MPQVPPIVVGAVELVQHLLRRLRRQVCQPEKLRTGLGELDALRIGAQRQATVAIDVLPLVYC